MLCAVPGDRGRFLTVNLSSGNSLLNHGWKRRFSGCIF
ncbi:hypothetical protein OROMI_010459 [Orobanche minor]